MGYERQTEKDGRDGRGFLQVLPLLIETEGRKRTAERQLSYYVTLRVTVDMRSSGSGFSETSVPIYSLKPNLQQPQVRDVSRASDQ